MCSRHQRGHQSSHTKSPHCCIRCEEITQHIILGFLGYSVGIPEVLEGDLFRYSFRRMSAFSAPFWMIYFVGTKMLNTINLTCSFSNGCMAQWIMRCPYKSKDSGSTPARWDVLFSFFRSCFVSFLRKHIGSVCSINLLGNKVTFDSKPKKVRTYFLLWDYYEYRCLIYDTGWSCMKIGIRDQQNCT